MDTYTVTIETGTGGAAVKVLATGRPTNLIGHSVSTTSVNVGDAGSVLNIGATLTVNNPVDNRHCRRLGGLDCAAVYAGHLRSGRR